MELHLFIHSGILLPFLLALVFAFSNGFRDSSAIVATVVSTRVLAPATAFVVCAGFEFVGAVFIGQAVAATVGGNLSGQAAVVGEDVVLVILSAALLAALLWGVLSGYRGWPASNNQALVAGLLGSAASVYGAGVLSEGTLQRLCLPLILSPFIGFLMSALLTAMLRWVGEWLTPRVKTISESLHVLACLLVTSAHGSNGGQLIAGVLMPGLLLAGFMGASDTGTGGVPFSIRCWIGAALSFGLIMGGRRVLKRMNLNIYRIRDTEGLGAEVASACTIVGCAAVGLPASTTQVITGSIVGAGVAKNPRNVRWETAQEIMLSWLVTLPVVALMGYLLCTGFLILLR